MHPRACSITVRRRGTWLLERGLEKPPAPGRRAEGELQGGFSSLKGLEKRPQGLRGLLILGFKDLTREILFSSSLLPPEAFFLSAFCIAWLLHLLVFAKSAHLPILHERSFCSFSQLTDAEQATAQFCFSFLSLLSFTSWVCSSNTAWQLSEPSFQQL